VPTDTCAPTPTLPSLNTCPPGSQTPTPRILVYVANSLDDSVSVIDARANTPFGPPIALRVGDQLPGIRPQNLAFSPDHRFLYVTNFGAIGSSVSRISTQDNALAGGISKLVPNYGGTLGVAVNDDERSCDKGSVYTTNITDSVLFRASPDCFEPDASGNCLSATTRGFRSPYGVAFFAGSIYVTNARRAVITVVKQDLTQDTTIPAGSARGIAVMDANTLVVANPQAKAISVLYRGDCAAWGVETGEGCHDDRGWCVCKLPVGNDKEPESVAVDRAANRAYVTNRRSASFWVVDTASRPPRIVEQPLRPPLEARLFGVAVRPDGEFAYITGNKTNQAANGIEAEAIEPGFVWVVETQNFTTEKELEVGTSPRGIAVGEVPPECGVP